MKFHILLSSLSLCVGLASASDSMKRPDNFKEIIDPLTSFHVSKQGRLRPDLKFNWGGKVNMAYFTSWSIYARKFTPLDIDASTLTHLYYAFCDMDPVTGTAILSDLWADQQIAYPGDDTSAPGNNLYGNLKQLYLLKKKNPTLKTVLSCGGWTFSQAGHFAFATNKTSRATFVKTAVQLLEDNGFDGLNIDWEYPQAGEEAEAFVSLLSELRRALNALAKKKGDKQPYELNVAVPAGSQNYQNLQVKKMNKHVTFWSIIAYDYGGPWSPVVDYLDNVKGGVSGVSTEATARWYVENGADVQKIVIGAPLYGRGFENTDGMFKPFNGVGPGTWDAGQYDYKALPFPNATVHDDLEAIASYSYDPAKRQLITYDTPAIATLKAIWTITQGYRGMYFWELSGDKNGTESLVANAAKALMVLDSTPNHLNYPGSQFANMRAGMN
ncbi:Endochitinase 1 [Ceratobasidium theobromae]|uniref:chitinase n=1 Tax=Ceratobasidium theobromae TaxID=1582974 RepID=A0A5N5QQF9_9AGAM|nr:Endochitinase 1 [Ceratobasidium theobromae]